MVLILKNMQCGRKGAGLVFNGKGRCASRFFCDKSNESKSDVSEQKVQEGKDYLDRRGELLKKARPYSAIPEIPMVPIFGSAWKYFPIIGEYDSKKMYEADFKKQRQYGDILKERFGGLEIVNCYHQDANDVLLKNQGRYPERAEFSTLKAYREKRKHRYGKLGLVAMQGEDWEEFRREVGNSVHLIPDLNRDAIVDIAKDFVELIRAKRDASGEIPDLMDLLYKWALESVSCIAMDARLGCLNPDMEPTTDGINMITSVHTQLECINKLEASSGNYPFWKYIPSPTYIKFEKAADIFTELLYKYITVTTNQFHLRDKTNLGTKTTILEKMLFQEMMSKPSVMAAVADIIMAGIDTTSHAAGYFLYNLAKNPDKQQLLYEELLRSFPGEEKTTIKQIDYFNWCMWESMRLLPVVRGNMRILKRDAVLLGYRIPAGTAVLSVQQVFTRDERFYDNPDKYMPERYADERMVDRANPFGLGKRSCLGERIAIMEIFAVVVEVLRNFRLEYNHEDIKFVTRLVNIPDRKIRMKFYDRHD